MRRFAVRDLITHAGSQSKAPAVRKSGLEFALQTKHDMPFGTPMIGRVAGRVFHHPHANVAHVLRAPDGCSGLTGMLGRIDLSPVRNGVRKAVHFHESSIASLSPMRGP